MEPINFLIAECRSDMDVCILLFNCKLTLIHLEHLAIFFILLLIVALQIRTIYLNKKKVKADRVEDKAILIAEQNKQNAVLQIMAEEQLQPTNTEIRNIPIHHRWHKMKKEIDQVHNYYTTRLK